MIVVRSPFRVSFAGGGSDLPAYYRQRTGAVVSTTIDKYMYLVIHPYFHDKIRVKYSRLEDVDSAEDIQHPIVRECLRRQQIPKGMEIASFADVPAGTGLGSSSAFTVGMLHALYAWRGEEVSARTLASAACEIEIDRLGEPIGKQDQYASAFGGLNLMQFHPDESVEVEPISLGAARRRDLESRLMLFYLGQERSARDILGEQSKNMHDPGMLARVDAMVELAYLFRRSLETGDFAECGSLLDRNWRLKRELADGISSPLVEELYDRAMRAGAGGGKLLGAGSAGFLLLYCEPRMQARVRDALRELREMPFRFSRAGSEVIFSDANEPVAADFESAVITAPRF